MANQALPDFTDGVAFVPLADVASAGDVPYAVLRARESGPAPGQPLEQAIEAYLAPRRLLLMIDNCEHILEITPLFAEWLSRSPHLKLLCTSRVPLDLYGEQEWPLAPLATLCVALDGLPLALELAAVRLRDLPLSGRCLPESGHGMTRSGVCCRRAAAPLIPPEGHGPVFAARSFLQRPGRSLLVHGEIHVNAHFVERLPLAARFSAGGSIRVLAVGPDPEVVAITGLLLLHLFRVKGVVGRTELGR